MKQKHLTWITLGTFLIVSLASPLLAQDKIYQKVTRKKVEIVPKSSEEDKQETQEQTIETQSQELIEPTFEEEQDTEPTPPPEPTEEETPEPEPTPEPDLTQTQEPAQEELENLSDITAASIPDIQTGVKVGAVAPGIGIVGELRVLPIKVSNESVLYTQASLGYSQSDDYKTITAYLNEIINFSISEDLSVYAGGGLNFPIIVSGTDTQGQLGINIVAGADNNVNLIRNIDESVFVEAGYNNFSITSPDENLSSINFLGGYKLMF